MLVRWLVSVVVAFAVLGSVVSISHAAPPPPAEKLTAKIPATKLKLFALAYQGDKGTVGQVRINDMPAITFSGEGTSGSSNSVAAWLMPGANRIDVVLTKVAGDNPARVSLHGLAEPGFPDESNELVRVAIKKGTAPGTRAYTFELPANQAPPSQLWKKAEVLSALSDADKKALRTLAADLLAATKKGDVPALKKLFAFPMEERARITYSDPKEALAMVEQMAPEAKKAFATASMSPNLEFTLVGGGRVALVTAPGDKPPIVAKSKDGEASMPIHAAKIDGSWTLVE
jgi:hypothetical protein